MIYDEIYIGGSLLFLIKAFLSKKRKILILEKSDYLGGAWRDTDKNFKKIDLACHLLVPPKKNDTHKIVKFFNKIGVKIRKLHKKEFYADTQNWQAYGKRGSPLISEEGWSHLLGKILINIKKRKNIKILKKNRVREICINGKIGSVITLNSNYQTKKIFFPSYCDLKRIKIKNKIYLTPFNFLKNIHLIILIESNKKKISRYFQGLWDLKPKNLFDRISISKFMKKNKNFQIIIAARIQKKYKRMINKLNKKMVNESLKDLDLFNKFKLVKFKKAIYFCYYRDDVNKKIAQRCFKKSLGIINYEDTRYFGHYLKRLLSKI